MSVVTTHERPGVYSSYDVSSVVDSTAGAKTVAIVAVSTAGEAGLTCELTRYEQAVDAFGEEDGMTKLVKILFLNGAAAVIACPVKEEADYQTAFDAIAQKEDVGIVVCDSTTLTVQQALRDSVNAASEARRERIAVICGGEEETVSGAVSRAKAVNDKRVVLVVPCEEDGVIGSVAAAVAGAIAAESDPAVPLGGAQLKGIGSLAARYADNEIDLLVRGGVTPLESVAGVVSVVRGITTKTLNGEDADATWRELTTILIVDDVIPAIRNSLRGRFRRAKNTEQSRGAVRSQVILELENKLDREIITGYDNVTVTAKEDDPTVCLVDFAFTVAHGINQIWLTAHITV